MVSDNSSKEDGGSLPALPQGWFRVNLGEFAFVTKLAGFEFTKFFQYLDNGDVRVIRALNIGFGNFKDNNFKFINKSVSDSLPRSQLGGGELLITYVGTLGSVAILPKDHNQYHLGPNVGKIVVDETIVVPKYCLYYLLSGAGNTSINDASKAVAQSSLSMSEIRKFPTPLAPLNEQHRIVNKIEELFTQLDAGVASLKKVQAQLKRYRQAVLKAAFEGRLTQEWRNEQKDLIPVQETLEQITIERQKLANINGKKIQPPLPISKEESAQLPDTPKGWHWVRLNELSGFITDGKHGDCRDETDSGYFFLSAKDIKNGKLHYENARQINKDDFLEVYNRTTLEAGDVVITNSGTIGRIAVIENNPLVTHTSFQKSVAIIKPIRNFFNSEYLSFYLLAVVQEIVKKSKGTAQKNLLIRDLKDFLIAVPTLEEQNAIVSEIERYFSQIDHLELTITTSLRQAETLRQSILNRAFEGKLVTQDPNDEPASILLERIKAKKAETSTNLNKGKSVKKPIESRIKS